MEFSVSGSVRSGGSEFESSSQKARDEKVRAWQEVRRATGSAEPLPGLRRSLTEMFKDRAARPCLPHVCG